MPFNINDYIRYYNTVQNKSLDDASNNININYYLKSIEDLQPCYRTNNKCSIIDKPAIKLHLYNTKTKKSYKILNIVKITENYVLSKRISLYLGILSSVVRNNNVLQKDCNGRIKIEDFTLNQDMSMNT